MDRWLRALRIGAFVLLLTAPLVFFRVRPVALTHEKRASAPFPRELRLDRSYFGELEAFFRDRFGFRERLLRLHHRLAFEILRQTTIGQVVRGSGGRWLFYLGRNDGIDMRDVSGNWPHDAATAARWASFQAALSRHLSDQGIRYLLVIAPNKQSVYPEEVPAYFGRPRAGMLDELLVETRRFPELAAVDLRATLRAHRSEGVYFHSDTHWNSRGSSYAAERLVDLMRPWFPALPRLDASDFRVVTAPIEGGDLAVMLGMEDRITDLHPSFRRLRGDPARIVRDGDADRIWEGAAGRPRVLLVGDSFGDRLAPMLAEAFSRTRFVNPWHDRWKPAFDTLEELAADEQPNVVIFEIAERYLPHLAP